jgi:hypothetical protein
LKTPGGTAGPTRLDKQLDPRFNILRDDEDETVKLQFAESTGRDGRK